MYVFDSGGVGGEWIRLGLGFTNPVGTGMELDLCLWAWARSGGVVLCLCEL